MTDQGSPVVGVGAMSKAEPSGQLVLNYVPATGPIPAEDVRTRGDLIRGVLHDTFHDETGKPLNLDTVAETGDDLSRILGHAAEWLVLEVEVGESDELLAEGSMFRWLALAGARDVLGHYLDKAIEQPLDCPQVRTYLAIREAVQHRGQGGCPHCTDPTTKPKEAADT
jgi:hypothetical protein